MPFAPDQLELNGLVTVPNLGELEGKLKISFVENEVAGIPLPGHAELRGTYRDVRDNGETVLADGTFTFDWEDAPLFDGQGDDLGYKLTFDGYTQEPFGPLIKLNLDAELTTFNKATINIRYEFGAHFLEGSAVVEDYEEFEDAIIKIWLTNEHGLKITLTNDTDWEAEETKIGEILNEEEEVLAEIYLTEGVPYVFTEDGEVETLFQ